MSLPSVGPDDLDLTDHRLLQRVRLALEIMRQKRLEYISEGRGREAHGLGMAMMIVWHSQMHPKLDVELPMEN
jgi:hypothetical protein